MSLIPTRREMWGTSSGDVALAVVVTIVAVLDFGPDTLAHPVLAGLVAVPACLALAWRRAHPVWVAVAIGAVDVGLAVDASGQFPPQTFVAAVLVAVYSCAAWTAGRTALVGGSLTLALVCTAHWVSGDGDIGDFWPFLVWGAAWFAGRLVRRRTLEAAAAERHVAAVQHRREAELREAEARERDRIARELHDVVAHAVSVMVVQAGAERLALGDSSPRTTGVLESVEAAGRQALVELRAMLAVLREAGSGEESAPQPDLAALTGLVAEMRATGLPVAFEMAGDPTQVPPGVGLAMYRLVQEALTNVLKHAPGAPTSVAVEVSEGEVWARVVNGADVAPTTTPGAGRGLLGMRERVALHGGDLSVGAQEGSWVVEARIPLDRAVTA